MNALERWERHLRGCATCAASIGPERLCDEGRILYRKVYRMLTRSRGANFEAHRSHR